MNREIVSCIARWMGADHVLIATLSQSVTTPIAIGVAEKSGGIPAIAAVIIIGGDIRGIVGPFVLNKLQTLGAGVISWVLQLQVGHC